MRNTYSVWHLDVQFMDEFFQSQNQFSHEWLNLQSNKKSFAHYILPRMQLFISSVNQKKSGSEWGIIFPKNCTIRCQTLYIKKLKSFFREIDEGLLYPVLNKMNSRREKSSCPICVFSLASNQPEQGHWKKKFIMPVETSYGQVGLVWSL